MDTSNSIQVVEVKNPFRRTDRVYSAEEYKGEPLAVILGKHSAEGDPDQIIVSINGKIIEYADWELVVPQLNEQIVIMPKVAGGGESGKQVWRVVAMIAIVIFAGWAAGAMGLSGGWAMAAQMAIVAGGGMLVNSLMPVPTAKGGSYGDYDISQVFGWNPKTVQKQGIPIPKFYGRNKLFGNIISANTGILDGDTSKETMEIVVALGTGPVEGVVSGGIEINNQLASNYEDVDTEEKKGELNQSAISLFSDTKAEYLPYRIVTYSGGSVSWITPDDDFTDLEIELLFDRGIYYANDQGGISAHSIGIKVEARIVSGSWVTICEYSVSASSVSPVHLSFNANLASTYTGGGSLTISQGNRYEIRVTKTTVDQTSSRYGDQIRLAKVREVLNDAFAYPGVSLLAVEALATDQLSGSLNVSCIQDGAIIDTYNGSAWTLQFSSNPAWVLWDILTQPVISGSAGSYAIERYDGMNPARLDLAKFTELATFCDDLVPDGNGGTEPRITFNGGFDSRTSIWEAALKVCEVARCILIWNGTEVTLAIDKPATSVQAFSDGNICVGTFQESYMPQSERVSEIEITYRDKSHDYERNPYSVFDVSILNTSNKMRMDLFGTTKQSEAWRAGMYRLAQNRLLKSFIEFQAEIDAIACTVGDVIIVQSSIPDWGEGGRVISSTNNTVTLDRNVIGSGSDKILCRVYNPATEEEEVESHTVLSITDEVVTIADTWSVNPSENDIYLFGPSTDVVREYRITGLTRSSDQRVTITAIEYNEDVYGHDAESAIIPIGDYSSPGSVPQAVIDQFTRLAANNMIPANINEMVAADVPLISNVTWNDDTPSGGSISWSATDGSKPMAVLYRGVVYAITANNSSNSYIFWDEDSSNTTFQGTDVLTTSITGADRWMICVNDGGDARPVIVRDYFNGGLIQANTINANKIVVAELAADSGFLAALEVDTANIANLAVKTAHIDELQVTTLRLADGATRIIESAGIDGVFSTTLQYTWQSVISDTIVSAGGSIMVTAYATFYSAAGPTLVGEKWGLYRDSILLCEGDIPVTPYGEEIYITVSRVDIPGAGSTNYYLKAYGRYYDCYLRAKLRGIYLDEGLGK